MTALETVERNGFVGHMYADPDPFNPREDYDRLCVLTQLADHYAQPDDSFDERIVDAWNRTGDCDTIERYARVALGAVAVGWWDDPRSASRIFGYLTREAAEREGVSDPKAYLKAELEEYEQWCEGDVYGIVIETEEGEEVDSGWGFYGYDYAVTELNSMLDWYVNDKRDKILGMYRDLVNAGT